MPYRSVDPAELEGEALMRWYLRSPHEIEEERRSADRERYDAFFGGAPEALLARRTRPPSAPDWDERAKLGAPSTANGRGELLLIGNPANRRLRWEWEQREGRPWPKDEEGRNYDVGHSRAKADGGGDTLDNIGPVRPEEHRQRHLQDGDFARWGRRPGIARAFGGTVARSVGPVGLFANLLGILSGRVRTDSFDNFSSDMMGWPSQEDRRRALEDEQRMINPHWKPGDDIAV